MLGRKKQPAEPTAEDLLEQRVDAMMSVTEPKIMDRSDTPKAEPVAAKNPALPSLDIFAGVTNPVDSEVKSAPLLPKTKQKVEPATAITTTDNAPVKEEVQSSEASVDEPQNFDTPDTDAAIDDIVAQEADAVLAAEDAGLAAQQQNQATDDDESDNKHPIFWFFVYLFAGVIILLALLLFGVS